MRFKVRRNIACATLAGAAALAGAGANAVILPTHLGPVDLPATHFPTAVVGGSFSNTSLVFGLGACSIAVGPFTAAQVAPCMLGSDISTGLGLGAGPTGGPADFVVPGFGSVSIVNGAGADLIVWEAGSPTESFLLGISTDGGATFSANISYVATPTVPGDASSGFATNTAYIDLTDFGVGAGVRVDAVRLEGLFTGVGGSGPDILAVGVINAGLPTGNVPGGRVPEPGSLALLGLGLAGLGALRRRR